MVKDYILGKMEEGMKENTIMIKNMDMVYTNGLMVENMKVNGKMANNTDMGNIYF